MKKTLSLILALMMVLSLFSGLTVTASAEGEEGETDPTGEEYWAPIGGIEAIASAAGAGTVAITATTSDGSVFILSNTNGTGALPTAISATITDGRLVPATGTLNSEISWVIEAENDGFTVYNASNTATWLYTISANNGVRVGTNDQKTWVYDSDTGYLKHVGTGRYLGVYNSQDWRAYTNTTGNIKDQTFQLWKLSSGDTPAHEHNWSAWSSNNDGTHSCTCLAEGCPIGTRTENCSYEESVLLAPTCGEEGKLQLVCEICGYTTTETIPATGEHVDEDEDGLCDVCGQEMPVIVIYTLGTELNEGDQVVIYSVAGSVALSTTANGRKLEGVSASVSGEELKVTDEATAVLTVEYAGTENFRLKTADGRYLTCPATGNGLSFAAEAGNYSLWYLEPAGDGMVYIKSTNAAYNNKVQAMEFYNNLFTVFGENTTDLYQFRLYIHANETPHTHEWTGAVTLEPTCTAEGVMTYTCSGCEASYTEPIPMIPHKDADENGFCDACEGRIFTEAAALNDGDSVIFVSGNFGRAMVGTVSSDYLDSAAVNAQEGVTVPTAENNVWTVKTAEGGFYLINSEGAYLYVNGSNRLALGDETSANILWTVAEPVEDVSPTGAYLRNEGSQRYIEYSPNHENYQTYASITAQYETWFAFTFYTVPGEPTVEITLRFDACGGTVDPESKTAVAGQPVGELPVPEREGWLFLGWFKAPAESAFVAGQGEEVTAETVLDEDTELYAHWFLPGDINGDGEVNNKDVTRLINYIKKGGVTAVERALDVNGDGSVSNKDVTRLITKIKHSS